MRPIIEWFGVSCESTLPMFLLLILRPAAAVVEAPAHGSMIVGRCFAISNAAGLRRAGSMRLPLPANGPRRVTLPAALQAGRAYWVKSPASIAGVRAKAERSAGVSRSRVP